MDRIQSIFKKTHKLLFSTVALLLILCLTPTTAFADELYTGGAVDSNGSQGNTSIGSGGKSNGKSEAGTHRSTSSKWIGYRIYMVDDKGNVLGDSEVGYYVTDIMCNNMNPNYSEGDNYGVTLRVNKNTVKLTKEQMKDENKIKSISVINAMSGIAGQMPAPTVAAGGYESPNGEAFKAWMNLENNSKGANGETFGFNTNWLVGALWGQDAYDTYTNNPHYYLVVETIYQCYLWTQYTNVNTYTYETVQGAPIYIQQHLYYEKGECRTSGKHLLDICEGETCTQRHETCLKCHENVNISFIDLVSLLLKYGFSRDEYPKQVVIGYETQEVIEYKYKHYCDKCPDNFCGVKLKEENGETYISEYTNTAYLDTWYGWMKFNADPKKNKGLVPYTWRLTPVTTSTGYLALAGNSLLLEKDNTDLNLFADPARDSNRKTLAVIDANRYGYGIHLYKSSDAGNGGDPIHTKNPVDPTPSDPNDPTPPETPQKTDTPNFDNTGSSTIIKVYGEIYKDGSTVYHIDHKATYSETQTTDWIVIEDESKYKLQQWVVSGGTPDTSYTTTQWLNTDGTYSFDKETLFTNSSAGYKLTYTAEDNFKIGEGRTIYLLYLKTLPAIETSDKPTPFTPDPTVPNPTKPENPSSDKNNQNNPDKKGSYNIVKIYAILDKYNGTPLKSETYTQSSTTPFIKIESESNWTLAHWYTTNTHKPTVTGEDFFTKATDAQLKAFYENGYNLKPESTISSVIGTTIKSGTQPTTTYFTSGNTVYLLFTRTEGQANYDATQQLITESYLAKRFSTLGYWDATGFHKSDLTLTVTTDSGTVEEAFRNHIFAVLNPSLPSGTWTDKSITFKVLAQASTTGNIISNYSKVHSALDDYKYSNITPYYMSQDRTKLTEETMLFSNLEYRFTAYRQGDKVTLAQWKVDSGDTFSNKASRKESATGISNATSNYFSLANSKSTRTNSTELSSTTSLVFKAAANSDLTSATTGGSRNANVEDIREIQVNMGVKTQVYAGKSTVNGTLAETDKHISGKNGDTAYSGRVMSSLVSGSSNKITFTPYIKMQYDSNNLTNNVVYVTGRYGRTLTVNEYAGIYFKVPSNQTTIFKPNTTNKEDGKIQLSSNQWSTHASATAKVGENCVLPGGATLNISVPEDARNTLHVETYYPILAGTGLNQVNSTGGSASLPSSVTDIMEESHNKFVVSTISGLETLNVQQWVSGELSADSISDDILTDRKTNKPVWSMSGATAPSYEGKDGKYYFRDDNDNDNDSDTGAVKSGDSNTGDLDVKQGNTVITYYTFYANANGDIYCKKHSDLGEASKITSETEGELVLAKGENISKIRPNYLNINNKTGIVTNIVAALERNTGNDKNAPWASEDGHWYNEAFDGITYAVIDTSIEIGFINPYERTSVLDPELTPSNSGKNDFFTSYSYSQFKMKEYCELYNSTIGKIGKYRDYDICSDYLDEIMISDIFLIPNVNVQDLK